MPRDADAAAGHGTSCRRPRTEGRRGPGASGSGVLVGARVVEKPVDETQHCRCFPTGEDVTQGDAIITEFARVELIPVTEGSGRDDSQAQQPVEHETKLLVPA